MNFEPCRMAGVSEWCTRTIVRILEELSTVNERSLHLLDSQRVQLELLFRELVAVDVLESSGAVSIAVGLVREALSIIQDLTQRHIYDTLYNTKQPLISSMYYTDHF